MTLQTEYLNVILLHFHFFPGFVSGFTGGGVRGNSGRCGHDESGKTHPSCGLIQEMKIH